ncbi:MAG: hypothetical protein E7560_03260 [Ruminococcaceae bacterium]|nr:hypothetical protein [Oscillospiraceae bacterium]
MSAFNCNNRIECGVLAVISSLIIGIITAFLTITAVISVTPAFLWVALGIAVVYLAVLLLSAATAHRAEASCACSALSLAIFAVLGTALFSVVLLAIEFAATSVIGAIITGLLLFFLSLILTSTACFIKCLFNCNN